MYFVDRNQIERRLAFIDVLTEGCREADARKSADFSLTESLAQERLLHLAVETVTDVGSLLIDAFILRDAASYEDIIDILKDEGAIDAALHAPLAGLVRLRRPLVQDYVDWPRDRAHEAMASLPAVLERFRESVRAFIAREDAGR